MKTGRLALALAVAALGACAGTPVAGPIAKKPTESDASASVQTIEDAPPASALDAAAPAVPDAADPPRSPQAIATGLDAVEAIALDETDVYVLTHPAGVWRLVRVPKRGGAVIRLDDFHAEAMSLAVDDHGFYVATALKISEAIQGGAFRTSSYGRVVAASKVGGGRATIFDGLRGAYGVAIGGSDVYWLSGAVDVTGAVVVDSVMRGRASGGGAGYVAMKQIGATSVAVDGSVAYWTVAGRFDAHKQAWPPGALVRGSGGAPSVVAATGAQPRAIALDDASAYWIERDGALVRVPKTGGAASSVVDQVDRFALDGARVYWSSGAVLAGRPKGGGDVAKWDAGAPVTAIAVDGAFVYFASAGEVRRLAK